MAIKTEDATKVLVEIVSSPIGYLIEMTSQKKPRLNGGKKFFLKSTNTIINIIKLHTFIKIAVKLEHGLLLVAFWAKSL